MCYVQVDMIEQTGKQVIFHPIEGRRFVFRFCLCYFVIDDMMMTFESCPNEIVLQCFEYLNGFEIFQSFDRLNDRFSRLIHSISFHLNFQHIRRDLFDQFCQIIQSNPHLKQHITSLQLSNANTCQQIDLFLSKFSLDEWTHLQSLTLIHIEEIHIPKLKFFLPRMHQLHSIRLIEMSNGMMGGNELLTILPLANLRMLTIPILTQIDTTSIITHLSITDCSLDQIIYWLMKCTPRLKYLTIANLCKASSQWRYDSRDYHPVVHLKQLIIQNLAYSFEEFASLIKQMPNLRHLAICTLDNLCMIHADQWEDFIGSFLPNLKQFQFIFGVYYHKKNRSDILAKFQQFERDFWSKEHRWFIEYVFDAHSAVIYTVPYLLNTYRLSSSMERYSNQSKESCHTFDHVRDLVLCDEMLREKSLDYFPQVTSLELTIYPKRDRNSILPMGYIQSLKTTMDLYHLKHLDISSYTHMNASFLMELCQATPQLVFLTINRSLLSVLLGDRSLCEYLNERIRKIDVYKNDQNTFQNTQETEQFCELFPNINELICGINQSDQLLTLLNHSSNLSIMTVFFTSANNLEELLDWFKHKALELGITYRISCFYSHPDGPDGLHKAEVRIWINRTNIS